MAEMEEIRLEKVAPMEIEKRSFEIITQELEQMGKALVPGTEFLVKRCIHTSADFEYADSLAFSEGAIEKGMEALREGCDIVTDTHMAEAGISKKTLARLGGTVHCYMSDPDVAIEAKERGITRAVVSMDKAARQGKDFIYAIGNAPTALVRLSEQIAAGEIHPKLVIGVPVGFVNVVASKELIMRADVPYIVARGRKGGSNIAACIVNALLYQIDRSRGGQK